jgi:hypothetical protein
VDAETPAARATSLIVTAMPSPSLVLTASLKSISDLCQGIEQDLLQIVAGMGDFR